MRYWWVNQNQTFVHEITGGYLWSPKKNSNGARNQFYENMQLVEPGDIVFSFAGTFIKAIGIASGFAKSSSKPTIFGQAGQNWSQDGWQLPVDFLMVEHPIRPKEHMHLLAPLLPEKYSPLTSEGNGLQGVYLAEVPSEMGSVLLGLLGSPALTMPTLNLEDLTFSSEEQEIVADAVLTETEKATLVLARRGQGKFRSRVQAVEQSCRVTGVSSANLLIASHIKPWKDSINEERLNGNNGLFLSPHVDRLFDGGFISFTDQGELLASPSLDSDVLGKWHINPLTSVGKFNGEQAYFLEYHRKERYKAA
jgi:putative restriction endonuclease